MIYTVEQWEKDNSLKAKPGQQIAAEIYESLFDCLPPRRLPRAEFPVAVRMGFMFGEPYAHAEVNGRYLAFYAAFGRNGDACYFLGFYSVTGDKLPEGERKWGEVR